MNQAKMIVSKVIVFPLLFAISFTTLAQEEETKLSKEEIEQIINGLELKIDSLGWSKRDKEKFRKIKDLIYNDVTGDVYQKIRAYNPLFTQKLNEVIGLSDLYNWDAEYSGIPYKGFDKIAPLSKKKSKELEIERHEYRESIKDRYAFGIYQETEKKEEYIVMRTIFYSQDELIILKCLEQNSGDKLYFKDYESISESEFDSLLLDYKRKFSEIK